MCRLVLPAVVAVLALVAPLPASARAPGVAYEPPVDAPVVDPFRPPENRWDRGNRGIDYATVPGTPVRAAADGEVVFAGPVGGRLHAVVLHPDGIRTSYSFLDALAVRRGDRVRRGEAVGWSGERLHFGARAGETYIDPMSLFAPGPPRVHLVPDEARRPLPESREREGLTRFLGPLSEWARAAGSAAAAGAAAVAREAGGRVADNFEELRGAAAYADMANPYRRSWALARHVAAWWGGRHGCTPAGTPPPPVPEPRVAVLVGGLGSTSRPGDAHIAELDTTALGYARTVRFSYTGGTVGSHTYEVHDTTNDLRHSGRLLSEVLRQIAADHPGHAVDILAHSQGGLVARSALAYDHDGLDRRLPRVANLITLGTAHRGADLATAARMFSLTESGGLIAEAVDAGRMMPFDIRGRSVRQMSETSWFLLALNRARLPDGVRFTSIGARGDVIVPAGATAAPGARNVTVPTPGLLGDHTALPGSAAAHREVALAAAGMGATCESFGEMLADHWVTSVISGAEDAAGAALYASGRTLDRYGVQDPPVALPWRRR